MKNKQSSSTLLNFVGALKLKLAKSDLELDLTNVFEDLNEIVIPMYGAVSDRTLLNGPVFDATDVLMRNGYKEYRVDAFTSIKLLLEGIADNEDAVFDNMLKSLNDDTIKHIIDYRTINILKYFESVTNVTEFARRWLLATSMDALIRATGDTDMHKAIVRADINFVTDRSNIRTFVELANILSRPIDDFEKSISKLKGNTFNVEMHEATMKIAGRKIDPNGFGFIPTPIHPVYQIGLIVNTWWAEKHNRNKEDLARLQLTIAGLEEIREDSNDSDQIKSLTKQIDYHANRANKIATKIEQIEEGV